MNVIIIEDESRLATELAQILKDLLPTVTIMETIESVEQGTKWFSESHPSPDVIFSDIQLADGLSFELYKNVKVDCPIIFCTAYDEYLMEAFETNAVSYLMKPVTRTKVQGALSKLESLRRAMKPQIDQELISRLLMSSRPQYRTTLLVNHRDTIIPLPVKDIAYIYLNNSIIQLGTLQGQQYFVTTGMDELEKSLDPHAFYRANRQYLVNRHAIKTIERFFSRKLVVILTIPTEESVIVSKSKASEFLHWLENVADKNRSTY